MVDLKRELATLQEMLPSQENLRKENDLHCSLIEKLIREELHWCQKSRVRWLTKDDNCTKFFFISTLTRRWRNSIDYIKDNSGTWLNSWQSISYTLLQKLQSIYCPFSANLYPYSSDTTLSDIILPIISEEENLTLCTIPEFDEIKDTLFGMGSIKAPRPDGIPILFYKHY
ncbi:hypothetical protein PanWU01x14_046510 [Parasponia andersonii]|uniref:Uncharacterized protein n=1 Tax=Parasponia andersonii TaxID=3476 RepID=A0A2P5DNS4_PARAD|nr:hypothetical protein PanWU01x14_046510 [Parasponia andersonii]